MSRLNTKGVTQIELMVTIIILIVGLLGAGGLLSNTYATNATSKKTTAAALIAERKIEELKAAGYALASSSNDTQMLNNITYTRTWTVTDITPGWLKRATVTVTWAGKTVVLRAYIMN